MTDRTDTLQTQLDRIAARVDDLVSENVRIMKRLYELEKRFDDLPDDHGADDDWNKPGHLSPHATYSVTITTDKPSIAPDDTEKWERIGEAGRADAATGDLSPWSDLPDYDREWFVAIAKHAVAKDIERVARRRARGE